MGRVCSELDHEHCLLSLQCVVAEKLDGDKRTNSRGAFTCAYVRGREEKKRKEKRREEKRKEKGKEKKGGSEEGTSNHGDTILARR